MAKIVIVGAGFAGHTAALYLGDSLGKNHSVTVVNRQNYFAYIPSWVWVGIGHMPPEKTTFPLEPVYSKLNVNFIHGKVTEIHADNQFVLAEENGSNNIKKLEYDYLIISTGPKLNFDGTKGLGPNGFTYSICTLDHAVASRDKYLEIVERMKKGEKQKIVIGTGHPGATCQGAALEYITNIHKDLVKKGIRDKAEMIYFSNERALGDFGVRGVQAKYKGEVVSSEDFIGAVFKQYGFDVQVQRGAKEVNEKNIYWENFNGEFGETEYDFAMLVPQFLGQPFKYVGKDGEDISSKLTNPGGFILVDGIYGLTWDVLSENPDAWPAVYQNRNYRNIFAGGIAFAPPGPISKPHTTPNGTSITAAPPRTGMVSGIIGRIIAKNIIDLIERGRMTHHERMSDMAAACIASMGDSLWDGSAATIMMYPVVPDARKFPNEQGRDSFVTHMEMGLAGAWMKRMIHTTFMHKLRARIGWKIIPE
ncbi:MAG: FAD-dependent oxidoreductase [Ignavibacteriae bacterium]|nr:FAD-dependent oxidoreductase [Ignavibacteriota bacterium]